MTTWVYDEQLRPLALLHGTFEPVPHAPPYTVVPVLEPMPREVFSGKAPPRSEAYMLQVVIEWEPLRVGGHHRYVAVVKRPDHQALLQHLPQALLPVQAQRLKLQQCPKLLEAVEDILK